MANAFKKLHINSALKSRNQIDLSHKHLTTMDFGQFIPIYSQALLPGDKFNVNVNSFSRVAPMVFPTYGNANVKLASVFVPYYQIASEIEGWLQNERFYKGKPTLSRYINSKELMFMFTDTATFNTDFAHNKLCDEVQVSQDHDPSQGTLDYDYDFAYMGEGGEGDVRYYKFTRKGRYFYKILRCLGYDIIQNFSDYDDSGYIDFNALPLISFFKAYNDWFSRAVTYNNSYLTNILGAIYERNTEFTINNIYNTDEVNVIDSDGLINRHALYRMFNDLKVVYEKDYFTSAWAYPNSPYTTSSNSNVESGFYYDSTNVVHTDDKEVYYDNGGQNVYLKKLTNVGLKMLTAFDNFIRRKNYSGSRAVNRILAQFGITPSEKQANYAEFIELATSTLQIGDVTQTSSSTDTEFLGSFAGKGIQRGDLSFDYESKDYGQLFVIAYINVEPMYFSGIDREVMKNSPLDFYNPEFDTNIPQAISAMEVWNDPKIYNIGEGSSDADLAFGFTERYNEYRYKRDNITGDFQLYKDMMPWHFGRDMSFVRGSLRVGAQSPNVTEYHFDKNFVSEYDRIFADNGSLSKVDHFFMTFDFNVRAQRPIQNLSQATGLGDGDLTIDREGEQID